jgi:polyisoprenoid-binding protein YceI
MKSLKLMGVLAGVGVMAAGAALLVVEPAPASAVVLSAPGGTIDPVHSSVVFKVKHMGKANFYGVFKDVSGTFSLDEADASKSSIDVAVKADSVDTRNGGRDNHAKSADFLSAKEFPSITFKSTSVKKTGDKAFDVTGDMTFRGVTKPVTAKVTQTDDAGKGIEATFSIKRSDFGNNSAAGKGLSDEVDFIVALEAK